MIISTRKAIALAVVAGGLNLAVVAPVQAQTLDPAEGQVCGLVSITDPTIENGEVKVGEVQGGPLVATSAAATIQLRCTVQVGASNSTHSGADTACVIESATSIQTAVITPTPCWFPAQQGQPVFLCSQAIINGRDYYYDSFTGTFSPSSGTACTEAFAHDFSLGEVLELLDDVMTGLVHPVTCPVVGIPTFILPGIVEISGGDIKVLGVHVWDCPPYAP